MKLPGHRSLHEMATALHGMVWPGMPAGIDLPDMMEPVLMNSPRD